MKLGTLLRAALILVLGLADSSCGRVPAQLVVEVDSDMLVPSQLDELRVRVFDAHGAIMDRHEVPLSEGDLPGSFGVAPRDGDPTHIVTIEIDAFRGGCRLFTHRTVTGFLPNRRLALDVFLAGACRDPAMGPVCPPPANLCNDPRLTCGREGICEPVDRPADTLREFGSDGAVPIDSRLPRDIERDVADGTAPMDSTVGIDTPVDSSSMDAGRDTAAIDSAAFDIASDVARDVVGSDPMRFDELASHDVASDLTSGDAIQDATLDVQCSVGLTACGATCVDVLLDPSHCGSCAVQCAPPMVCSSGMCTDTCDRPTVRCGNMCVNPLFDVNHCGACGVVCASTQACVFGTCACPNPLTECASRCTDLRTDDENCGGCGVGCNPGFVCSNATCSDPSADVLTSDATGMDTALTDVSVGDVSVDSRPPADEGSGLGVGARCLVATNCASGVCYFGFCAGPCVDDCDCPANTACFFDRLYGRICAGGVVMNTCPTCVPDCDRAECGSGGCAGASPTLCGTCGAGTLCASAGICGPRLRCLIPCETPPCPHPCPGDGG